MRVILFALAATALLACARTEAPLTIVDGPEMGQGWVVINYWAIWCAPCREEIPEFNTLFHRGLVDVYAVNFDELRGDELVEQALELDIQFPLLARDPGPGLGAPRPGSLPVTLIVNPEGQLASRLIGTQSARSVEAEIARLQHAPPTVAPPRE